MREIIDYNTIGQVEKITLLSNDNIEWELAQKSITKRINHLANYVTIEVIASYNEILNGNIIAKYCDFVYQTNNVINTKHFKLKLLIEYEENTDANIVIEKLYDSINNVRLNENSYFIKLNERLDITCNFCLSFRNEIHEWINQFNILKSISENKLEKKSKKDIYSTVVCKSEVVLNINVNNTDLFDIKYLYPLKSLFDGKIELVENIIYNDPIDYFKTRKLLGRRRIDQSDWPQIITLTKDKKTNEKVLQSLITEYQKSIESGRFFIGNKEHRISDETKLELGKKLSNLINKNKEFPFERYLITYFTWLMIKNKKAYVYNDKTNKWEIDKIFITNFLLEVKSYSEGIWQIIENAFLHSKGEKAFFGIRLRSADVDVDSNKKLIENANTRKSLNDKYCNNKTDNIFTLKDSQNDRKKYQDFIEVFVIDQAVDYEGNILGIVDSINNSRKLSKSSEKLCDLFNLDEDDYVDGEKETFYLSHYGLRWLHRQVERSNGILYLFSPSIDDSIDKKIYYSNCDNKTCIDYLKSKKINLDGFNPYFSDYNIIIPISYRKDTDKLENKKQNTVSNYFKYVDLNKINLTTIEVKYDDVIKETLIKNDNNENPDLDPKISYINNAFIKLSEIYQKIVNKITNDNDIKYENDDYGIEKKFESDKLYGGSNIFNQSNDNEIVDLDNEENVFKYEEPIDLININLKSDYDQLFIEIIAKAIFKFIYQVRTKSVSFDSEYDQHSRAMNDLELYFAINFGDSSNGEKIREFIRIFSIFYLKVNENDYMNNVQIALYSHDNNKYNINFIIAGNNLSSAWETANNYVYYNYESSIQYVKLLNYLVDKSNVEKANSVELFPFELILKPNNEKSIFINNLNEAVTSNYSKEHVGCKISDVKIGIGNRVCIDTFYEGDLLFQNVANVKRLAYLIANNIINNIVENKTKFTNKDYIYILGYENYSSLFIQEITQLVQKYIKSSNNGIYDNVGWIIGMQNNLTFPSLKLEKNVKNVYVYTIVPICLTMSTFIKLKDSLEVKINDLYNGDSKKNIVFDKNYCIIAVGDCYCGIKAKKSSIVLGYLENLNFEKEDDWKIAKLKVLKESKINEINFLISANSTWYKENDKNIENIPVIHLQKDYTDINATFQTRLPSNAIDYYNRSYGKDNVIAELNYENRFKCILNGQKYDNPYFYYGHISAFDDHYQFYFKYNEILNNKQNKELLEKWIESIKNEFTSNSYKVVISPLSAQNSSFMKIIMDKLFTNNFKLIHIDINNTNKEDIRTKFQYISKEIENIRNIYEKVQFFYVDDTVYSGSTIVRSKKYMDIISSNKDYELKNTYFDKVILFINRSSYETACTWVENPEFDWLSFIDIAIPSYNMHNGKCPGCKIMESNELLEKRSTTFDMARYFEKRKKKHIAKSITELENEFKKAECNDDVKINIYKKYKNPNLDTFEKNVVAIEDNKRRLLTTNIAYYELILNENVQLTEEKDDKNKFNKIDNIIKFKIMNLLLGTLEEGKYKNKFLIYKDAFEGCGNSDSEKLYNKVMMFSSMIKSISREHLVHNYLIKKSIYEIMHCIYLLLLTPKCETEITPENFKDYIDSFLNFDDKSLKHFVECIKKDYENYFLIYKNIHNINILQKQDLSDLQYGLFVTLTHSLSMLYSNIILKKDVLNLVLQKSKEFNDANKNINSDNIINLYIASFKTACLYLENETMVKNIDGLCNITEFKDNDLYNKTSKILYLENNGMIYNFIELLSDKMSNSLKWIYNGYRGKGSINNLFDLLDSTKENLKTLLDNCSRNKGVDKLYLNPLTAYYEYYKEKLNLKNVSETEIVNSINLCLNYYNVLKYISCGDSKGPAKTDELPYLFESLCHILKKLSECDEVYITYNHNDELTKIISRSGYSINLSNVNFDNCYDFVDDNDKIDRIIKFTDDKKIDKYIDGIYIIENKKVKYIKIELDFKNSLDTNKEEEQKICILLKYENLVIEKINEYLLKILFLRYRLFETLKNDYSKILSLRYNCEYIYSINKDFKDKNVDNDESFDLPNILHISDVHSDLFDKYDHGNNLKEFYLKSDILNKNIDLLAITGDIVNGSTNAHDAQSKYKIFGSQLLELSCLLWGYRYKEGENYILPNDWKRRILIVPGNHDYCTMSDVVTEFDQRKTTIGFPSKHDAGIMSKLTYYIEFIAKFLDAPIVELVSNDMNEVKHFENLNLAVGQFNTVSKANSMQNNKVGFMEDMPNFLNNMKWNCTKCKHHLVLMHHSPVYVIDYFDDKYNPTSYGSTNAKILKNILYEWNKFNNNNYLNKGNNKKDLRKNCNFNFDLSNDKFRRSSFYQQLKLFNEMLNKDSTYYNEFELNLISEISELSQIQFKDRQRFKGMCKNIVENIDNLTFLAGHEHVTFASRYNGKYDVFVSNRLKGYNYNLKCNLYSCSLLYYENNKYHRDIKWYNDLLKISVSNCNNSSICFKTCGSYNPCLKIESN